MGIYSKNRKNRLIEYDVDIRTLTFIILAVVCLVILIYFCKIYSNKKQHILHNLRYKAANLEKTFATDIEYSKYFLTVIAMEVKHNYEDLDYIKHIFKNHMKSSAVNNINNVFGWRKYSWIDENLDEIVTSTKGIISTPLQQNYIKPFIFGKNHDQIEYYVKKFTGTNINDSLKLIYNLFSLSTNEYRGSVALSHDIATMVRRLKTSLHDKQVHFLILDDKFKVVAQSDPAIKNIINKNDKLSKYLNNALRSGIINKHPAKSIDYLEMPTGTNYHIKKMDNLPFIIITNLDNNSIKNNIIEDLIKKFLEVGCFGALLFCSIIYVYRRETSLRAKAEKATIIANKATKAKSEFLAFTAHEIRSPLGFIVTGSEVMVKEFLGPMPDLYKSYVQGIYQNSIIILDFIKDILDESKIVEGKFQITNAIIEIYDVVQEAVIINKARFNGRKIEIYSQLDQNLPNIIGDKRRLLQVMNNLVSNAIKYSQDNTRITIRSSLVINGLKIEIEDQGIGMSQEEVKNIMDGINMTVKNCENHIDSYGLGLLIVKMLLEAHEAKLIIESRQNVGTIVRIIFPLHKLILENESTE